MFTGIIECLGRIRSLKREGSNITFYLEAPIQSELKIDQSVAHNGICLTVDGIQDDGYSVTAIEETIKKTTISQWKPGDLVNLERCLKADGRLDGHFVQGHVDTTAECISITDRNGSREYIFAYKATEPEFSTVKKGSITINGTSLTVVKSEKESFSVEIIPYTYENTVFKFLKVGDRVNIEFDILGKYMMRYLANMNAD